MGAGVCMAGLATVPGIVRVADVNGQAAEAPRQQPSQRMEPRFQPPRDGIVDPLQTLAVRMFTIFDNAKERES